MSRYIILLISTSSETNETEVPQSTQSMDNPTDPGLAVGNEANSILSRINENITKNSKYLLSNCILVFYT